MKAMILAAGRGERMRPLTDHTPKPLLEVGGRPLIVYHLEKLAAMGVKEVIINVAYLAEQVQQYLGDGARWGLHIYYSKESQALETAGALLQALTLLGDEPFMLVNGDVWTDYSFEALEKTALARGVSTHTLGHLVFVNNPDHNPEGDFCLVDDKSGDQRSSEKRDDAKPPAKKYVAIKEQGQKGYTFSGIALLHPSIIHRYPRQRKIFPLREVFDHFIEQQRLEGELYGGQWWDIGTPERLRSLDKQLIYK